MAQSSSFSAETAVATKVDGLEEKVLEPTAVSDGALAWEW